MPALFTFFCYKAYRVLIAKRDTLRQGLLNGVQCGFQHNLHYGGQCFPRATFTSALHNIFFKPRAPSPRKKGSSERVMNLFSVTIINLKTNSQARNQTSSPLFQKPEGNQLRR